MSGAEYGNIIVRHGHVEKVSALLAQQLVAAVKDWDIIWMPNFAKWTNSYLVLERILGHKQLLVRERNCSFSSVPLPPDGAAWVLATPDSRTAKMSEHIKGDLMKGQRLPVKKNSLNRC